MIPRYISALLGLALCAFSSMSHAADKAPSKISSAQLQELIQQALARATTDFAARKLQANEVAVTVADVTDNKAITLQSHRGNERIYPASVVKMFYLAAAHAWMEAGKISDTPELRRAMRDMIVESYNEATHYIVDLLTGTTSGPELPPEEMAEWGNKRNGINRYFAEQGYQNINANQKPWCEGPYGRERAWVGQTYTNRNMLTTEATAQLLSQIAVGACVTQERSKQMLELMRRDPFGPVSDPDDQSHGFTGPAVPNGAKLWSKAGWTSQTRHDAAYIELPNGRKVVLVIFTVSHANERQIIPTIARVILDELNK